MSTLGTILLRPVLPVWVLIVIVPFVAALVWYTYRGCSLSRRQRFGLLGFRLAVVLVIVWLLLQAERQNVRVQRDPPALALAVDVSASMTESIDDAAPTREARVREFLKDRRVRKALRKYQVREYELGAETTDRTTGSDEIVFNAPRSNLASGLNQVVSRLRAKNLAGVILLSDGLDQSGEDLAEGGVP